MDESCGACPEFRWLERGEGDPVVLLHGLMGRMGHWEEVLDALGDRAVPSRRRCPSSKRRCPRHP